MSPPTPPGHDFADRVRPFGAVLLRYLRAILHGPEEAEDVLQSTLVRALEAHERVDPGVPFRTVVLRIATNEARNANRRRQRQRELFRPLEEDGHDLANDPDPEAEMVYERVLDNPDWIIARLQEPVSRAVAELRDPERATLILHAVAELSCMEVAAVLEAPKGTVLAWLHRARAHLRRRLADYARSTGWEVGQP